MNLPNQSDRDTEPISQPEKGRNRSVNSGRPPGKRNLARNSAGGAAVVVLLGLYAFAQPILNERFGWDLPQLQQSADGEIAVADSGPATKSPPSTKPVGPLSSRVRPTGPTDDASESKTSNPPPAKAPTSSPPTSNQASAEDESSLRYGLLREIGPQRYMSPAGLLYTPGSAEGHRLEHLRRHIEDQPSRPGSHGVFDGEMPGALKTIDRAYEMAKKNQRTTKQVDGQRTIYTVDMGGRVGYVGGRDGRNKRNPMARRVRIILEGTRVITAYPM